MLQRLPSKRARRREQQRARMARCRQRAERGEVLVTVAITPSESEKLLRYKFLLSESELESKAALSEALHALISRLEV